MILNNIYIMGLSEALAWTLLHSIWQAVLVAGILAIVFRIINKSNARLRYAMASLGLLLIFISAALTFLLALPEKTLIHDVQASGVSLVMTDTHETVFSWQWLKSLLPTQILFPVLLRTWLVGVLLLSIKMLVNYIKALHLKKHKAFALNHRHFALAQALIKRFKISRKIIFRESALVDSPSLIGYLKPVVLLPISLLSGIPDNQLEIIIAHELAHIRRHDYLVQFIQGIIEILFFYHPVVWWLSSVVNTEREHICDDLAVKVCGESLTLIKALNNMESIRKKQPELVLNFSGKKANLLHRVRRILNPVTVKHPKLERGLMSALFVFVLSGMILFSNLANSKNQVKVETQNSTSLSIGDSDNNWLGQAAAINLAPQKKKKLKKEKETLILVDEVAIAAEPALAKEPSMPDLPAPPEAPEVPELDLILSDTLILIEEKEVEELIEIQEEALKDALKELDSVNVDISMETLKELESIDIGIDIEKELLEAEAEIQKEFEKHEKPREHHSFKDIDDNEDLNDKEKEELKAKIRATLKRVNSEEFRQEIRENLERAKDGIQRQIEKMKSGEFQKTMQEQKEKIKVMIKKFESPEYQKELKENLEKSRKNIEKHLEKLKSPEYRKELEERIENYKKYKRDTLSLKKTKIKILSSDARVFIVDGKKMSQKKIKRISPDEIASISILKDEHNKDLYGVKAEDGIVVIKTKKSEGKNKKSKKNKALKIKVGKNTSTSPVFIVDGVKTTGSQNLKSIDPNDIESINVLKGESALALYGVTAKNGVVLITTKKDQAKKKISKKNKSFKIRVGEDTKTSPVYIIDGVKTTDSQYIKSIDTDDIESMVVYKGEKALEVYGPEATDGVIVIKTKKKQIKTLKFNDYIESN